MNKVLIYITYDSFEYVNCYSLVLDGEILCELIPEERMGELFEKMESACVSKEKADWCIVQDEDVTIWNYESELLEHGYKINPLDIQANELCRYMGELFGGEYVIGNELAEDKKHISILYPENSVDRSSFDNKLKAINDAENILNKAGMTELAQIIREKYERMSRNE